jgi:hypothetical protein
MEFKMTLKVNNSTQINRINEESNQLSKALKKIDKRIKVLSNVSLGFLMSGSGIFAVGVGLTVASLHSGFLMPILVPAGVITVGVSLPLFAVSGVCFAVKKVMEKKKKKVEIAQLKHTIINCECFKGDQSKVLMSIRLLESLEKGANPAEIKKQFLELKSTTLAELEEKTKTIQLLKTEIENCPHFQENASRRLLGHLLIEELEKGGSPEEVRQKFHDLVDGIHLARFAIIMIDRQLSKSIEKNERMESALSDLNDELEALKSPTVDNVIEICLKNPQIHIENHLQNHSDIERARIKVYISQYFTGLHEGNGFKWDDRFFDLVGSEKVKSLIVTAQREQKVQLKKEIEECRLFKDQQLLEELEKGANPYEVRKKFQDLVDGIHLAKFAIVMLERQHAGFGDGSTDFGVKEAISDLFEKLEELDSPNLEKVIELCAKNCPKFPGLDKDKIKHYVKTYNQAERQQIRLYIQKYFDVLNANNGYQWDDRFFDLIGNKKVSYLIEKHTPRSEV